MKAELQKLIALQNLDTTIRKLEKDQEAIPERRAEIEREFDQRAFEIRALENRREEAKHTRARLENEVVEQRGRVERAERNLMSSKKQDEYTAAIREADSARKQISALETQILEQLETLEQAEAALHERASELVSLNSDRETRLKAFDEETESSGERLSAAGPLSRRGCGLAGRAHRGGGGRAGARHRLSVRTRGVRGSVHTVTTVHRSS